MPNVNRIGRVSAIDYESGTYEVTYYDREKSVTQKINALSNGEYRMPSIGQVVAVSHLSNGTGAAVSQGTVWNGTNRPAEGFKGLFRKEYGQAAGKAFERYDDNTGVYTQFIDKHSGRICNGDISDEAKGNLSLSAMKKLGLAAEEKLDLESNGTFLLNAAGEADVSCGGKMTVSVQKGGEITLGGDDVTLNINGVKMEISKNGEVKITVLKKTDISLSEINLEAESGKIVIGGRTL